MVKIFGSDDNLVKIENSNYVDDEIGCYCGHCVIEFEDGTLISVGYPKEDIAVWWINIDNVGSSYQELIVCDDEDDDTFSDVFLIDSKVKSHKVIDDE